MTEVSSDRLLLDLSQDGKISLYDWPATEFPNPVVTSSTMPWPLEQADLEELRWYLEEYLEAPFGVYEERGPRTAARLREWGECIFDAVFPPGPAREAWVRALSRAEARGRGPVEVVLRSASAELLGLPWELMAVPGRPTPAALDGAVITRSLPTSDLRQVFTVSGDKLRVLMVISRPRGVDDVGYRVIARPLLRRLRAVRGKVELVVLRPPTLEHLEKVLNDAREAGEPFQVVHFDGHGAFCRSSGAGEWEKAHSQLDHSQGTLTFESPEGGADLVPADRVARVISAAQVPVVVLNACQSAVVGSRVEATVATRLLQEGTAAVVAMAYSVYTVAAAEFMTAFYERLFAGDRVADAVAAGRWRLAQSSERPSRKGLLPLADWMVPVLYARSDVRFPRLRTERESRESVEDLLDQMRRPVAGDSALLPEEGGHGLPAPVGEFVGRDASMYLLEVAARRQRVVVLHGPGGAGKTELAKAFGRWYRDTGAVDDEKWVIWHSFEPGVASFGLDGIIDGIGLHVFGERFVRLGRSERQSAVENLLNSQRVLLIWDNFESAYSMPDPGRATPPLSGEERDDLTRFLQRVARGGSSAVLLTSRTREDWLGEATKVGRVEVGGLEPEEANEYADQLLTAFPRSQERRKSRAFGELMQWLDGHPLSMRLTLPHLENTPPESLLAGLQGTAPLPAHGENKDGRTESLTACIAYSFTHLPCEDQQELPAVRLFHGVVDTEVLGLFSEAARSSGLFSGVAPELDQLDARTEKWRATLNRAADLGLLTRLDMGMYRIHPALHAYLAQLSQLATDRQVAEERAFLEAYAFFSAWLWRHLTGGEAANAVTLIHCQRHTLGVLLGRALEQELWEHAHLIAQVLGYYWDTRELTDEARGWTDRAIVTLASADGSLPAPETPAGELWRFLVISQANRQLRAGHVNQAEDAYHTVRQALESRPATRKRQEGLAVVYGQLGRAAQQRGNLKQAAEWHKQSVAVKSEIGDTSGTATTYQNLGTIALEQGDTEQAEHFFTESLALKREAGHKPGMAVAYHHLSIVCLRKGELARAREYCDKSLAVYEDIGNPTRIAAGYHQRGRIAQECEDLEQAKRWYRKALVICERVNDRTGIARVYHQLGTVALLQEELGDAERWLLKALEVKESIGNLAALGSTYHSLALVATLQGNRDQAYHWLKQLITMKAAMNLLGNRVDD